MCHAGIPGGVLVQDIWIPLLALSTSGQMRGKPGQCRVAAKQGRGDLGGHQADAVPQWGWGWGYRLHLWGALCGRWPLWEQLQACSSRNWIVGNVGVKGVCVKWREYRPLCQRAQADREVREGSKAEGRLSLVRTEHVHTKCWECEQITCSVSLQRGWGRVGGRGLAPWNKRADKGQSDGLCFNRYNLWRQADPCGNPGFIRITCYFILIKWRYLMLTSPFCCIRKKYSIWFTVGTE